MCLYWPAGSECVDRSGRLSSDTLQVSRYEVPHPLQSCVLGVSEIFAYCHKKKTLQRFQLPQVYCCLMCPTIFILRLHPFQISLIQLQKTIIASLCVLKYGYCLWKQWSQVCILNLSINTSEIIILLPDSSAQDGVSSQQVVQLKPEQEVRGHPLGPASLVLSPHHLWLASVGRDGLLCIRETASMVGACFVIWFLVNIWIIFEFCPLCVLWCCCCTRRSGTSSCNVIHIVLAEFGVCRSLQTARHSSLLGGMMAVLFALISGKEKADCHAHIMHRCEQ